MAIDFSTITSTIAPIAILGDPPKLISELIPLEPNAANSTTLCWCADTRIDVLKQVTIGTIICSQSAFNDIVPAKNVCYLIVQNPRLSFLKVAQLFAHPPPAAGIAKSAIIAATASIAPTASIGEHVVIEDSVTIGEFSQIGHNTVVKAKTKIGNHVSIGSNTTLGGVGFGYEKNELGVYQVIPHLGNLEIGNYVDIGNNTAIDRGTLGSTTIEDHVKIDNCVHVAHNVILKQGAIVIAHAMIGGSTVVGENAWIAPTAALFQGITIGEECVIGIGAVVRKSTNRGEVLVGNPAKVLRSNVS